MRKHSFLLLLCILFFTQLLTAQNFPVSGTIRNARGEPVPFATVNLKGSKDAIAADGDGNFHLAAARGQVLIISATGYGSQQVTVNGNTLDVKLAEKDNAMAEVVVVALGQSQSKAKVGYSTSTFNSETINKSAPVGALDGLEGKIAGAEISNTGGPGSSTKVVLRSFGVIAGGTNQPLYVIDGVPLSDAQFQSNLNLAAGNSPSAPPNPLTNSQDFGNGMNDLNPNDIESITVLKGTAASSLYGGLAKNGAIMITTKKGKAGRIKVDYSGSVNFSSVGKLPDYQSEFGQGWGGVFVLSENGSWGPRLDGKERLWGSVVDNSQLLKPFSFQKNNLRRFYETGSELNNTVSMSGGTDNNQFYFSYGNVTSNGVVPTKSDYLERNTVALRTNSSYNKISINTSFNYVNRRLNVPGAGQTGSDGGGVFQSVLQIPVDIPIRDFKDYKNKFFNTDNYFTPFAENPYYALNENGNTQYTDRFFGNLNMSYKFTKNLSAEFRLGGDFSNARTKTWRQVSQPSPGSWNDGANPEGFSKTKDVGSVTEASDFFGIINGDLIVKYAQPLGKDLTLDVLAGGNYYQSDQRSTATAITDLVIPGFFNLLNTSLPPTTYDFNKLKRRMGVYGQAIIGYHNELYATINVRNDWSSTLPINNNSIFYPGANISWIASEHFSSKQTVSFLKFRVAYGQTGSDPDAYLVYPQLGPGNIPLPFGQLSFPFNGVSGFGINPVIGNANLKPIITDELEFGTEVKFLNNRIGIDATYYDKKDKGQIFAVPVALSTGYTNLVENLGIVSNRGIELTLNVKPVETKNFSWSFVVTYARNWNKVLELTGSTQNPLLNAITGGAELRAVLGKSVASIYGPVAARAPDGRIVVDATTGYPALNTKPLDQFGLSNGYYGTGLYTFTSGFSNNITYKNFSLNFTLDFRYGGVMFSETADLVTFDGNGIVTTYNDRKPFIVPNSVNAVNDGSGKTSYVENKTYIGAGTLGGHVGSDQTDNTYGYYNPAFNTGNGLGYDIFSKSFLKLRDINLSYSLPKQWASKIKASYASVAVYGRNFLLWVPKSNVYVDPEATNFGNDLTSELGEFSTGPLSKTFGVSLKIGF